MMVKRIKMNGVILSNGVLREMAREVGEGGIHKCATNILEVKIIVGFELV